MKIGELAARAGCQVQTIRFFEAEGLLQAPERSANNYRSYERAHEERLSFILRCRTLDMAHDEIRVLLALQDDPGLPCDQVNSLLEEHARHVQARITELTKLKRQIQDIRNACAGGACIGDCEALESLRRNTGPNVTRTQHVRGAHS
ncbi:MAG: Cd(II)/Pb(II)-responsive transcriptional regulator [Oxalobacteraceae bacterium]|nr:MAG: Cd(II)/Pb(II)-responsive transcriptional regulator [Oxalobacteraceae bacterium]